LMAVNRTGHLLTCMRPIELPLFAISLKRDWLGLHSRQTRATVIALRVKLGVFFLRPVSMVDEKKSAQKQFSAEKM